MSKHIIEIEMIPFFEENGVNIRMFMGDEIDASIDQHYSFEELVDKGFNGYTVNGKIKNHHDYDNIGGAENIVIALEQAAVYARKRFEELKDE